MKFGFTNLFWMIFISLVATNFRRDMDGKILSLDKWTYCLIPSSQILKGSPCFEFSKFIRGVGPVGGLFGWACLELFPGEEN